MPVLDPTTDLAMIALGDSYTSSLPPPGVSGSMNPVFAGLSHASFGADHIHDAVRLGALTDRAVAISTGWPAADVEALGDLVEAAVKAIDPGKVADALGNLAKLGELFANLSRTLADAISGVPILGWIIQVGLVVWDIVKIARFAEPAMSSNHPLAYEPDDDNYMASQLLKFAPGDDWTALFSPQPGSFGTQSLAYTRAGAADGFAWGQLNQSEATEGGVPILGLLPGVGAIAGYWQSPRKAPGSNRDANVVNVVANNQLLPSATSLSGLLWTANQAPGPMLARIDLHALAGRWEGYGAELAEFADSREGIERKQIRNGWRWTDEVYDSPLFGVERKDVPAEFRGWGLQNLVAWRLDLARSRVRQNMKTIAVAYVSPDSPGLSDAPTKAAWSEGRWRLLVHNARKYVDASIIPDAEYRDAMITAQKFGQPADLAPNVAAKPKKPGFGGPDGLLGREPDEPFLPLPPGNAPPGPEGGSGATSDAAGGLGLAVVAALALWAVTRK